MTYIISLTNPQGVAEFIPPLYGFGVTERTTDIKEAEVFQSKDKAEMILNKFINPPSFHASEIKHAMAVREKFSKWKCEVISKPIINPVNVDHVRIYQAESIECGKCDNAEEGSAPWGAFDYHSKDWTGSEGENEHGYYTCNECGSSCVTVSDFTEYRDEA